MAELTRTTRNIDRVVPVASSSQRRHAPLAPGLLAPVQQPAEAL